jgi:hypothetical protein
MGIIFTACNSGAVLSFESVPAFLTVSPFFEKSGLCLSRILLPYIFFSSMCSVWISNVIARNPHLSRADVSAPSSSDTKLNDQPLQIRDSIRLRHETFHSDSGGLFNRLPRHVRTDSQDDRSPKG